MWEGAIRSVTKLTGTQGRAIQLCGLAMLATPAFGQQAPLPPQVPPQVAPLSPTREEVQPPAAAPVARPRVTIEGDIEHSPCLLADAAYAQYKVTITDAQFNNLKGIAPEELRPAYAAYLGQERPVSVICDIRDAAATILRRKGYLAAIQVPTQRIENGVVRFEVLFARITAVRVRGDGARAEGLLQAYLGRLSDAEVFNRYDAERYLLLARDLPGYDVRLLLSPAGTGPGDLIGEVTVTRTPLEVDLNIQNLASRDTGRFGGQLRAQFYGLTGMGDRTTIAFYNTFDWKEQSILQFGHDYRVGGQGLTLSGRFTYAWTRPDLATPGLDINARTLFATGEASYPFIRSQARNLRGAVGFDYVNQSVKFGANPLTLDHLRVGYVRLDADATDIGGGAAPRWRAAGSLELRHGLDIFDATPRVTPAGRVGPSRSDGDATGTLLRYTGQIDYAFPQGVTVSVLSRGQYGFDPLLSFEEFSAGSYTIGRGYDPGTLIGESGVGVTGEFRIDRIQPSAKLELALQPFVFVDSAWVWNRGFAGAQRLTSVGGGVRASFANRVRLDMTLSVPTKRAGLLATKPDPRLLVSLTTKLWPWVR